MATLHRLVAMARTSEFLRRGNLGGNHRGNRPGARCGDGIPRSARCAERDRPPKVRPLPSRPPDLTPRAARLLLTLLLSATDRVDDRLPDPPDDAA